MRHTVANIWAPETTALRYTTSSGQTVTITTLWDHVEQGRRVVSCRLDNGQTGLLTIDNRPDALALIESERARLESLLLNSVPGIEEYLDAVEAVRNYREDFEGMMEDEDNDGVRPPARPAMTVEQARNAYPVAAAYMRIVRACGADSRSQVGYERRCAGKWAAEQIVEHGADVIAAADEMDQRIG